MPPIIVFKEKLLQTIILCYNRLEYKKLGLVGLKTIIEV